MALNESETLLQDPPAEDGGGFHVSPEPVVAARSVTSAAPAETAPAADDLPPSYGVNLLYVIARDPHSLFLYWDLDRHRLFDAGLAPRAVDLRVFREDGSEETTDQIEPAAGFCFVEVETPGSRYYCELGSYAGAEWRRLIRSNTAATPAADMSDDLSADFATVPLHLSFQRLVEIFRAAPSDRKNLAHSLATMQTQARILQESMSPDDWRQLVETAAATVDAESGFGLHEVAPTEMATLLRTVKYDVRRTTPSPEMLTRWREIGARYRGASWGGSSPGGDSSAARL